MFNNYFEARTYTLCVLGLGKTKSYTFLTRENANQHMYKLCGKHNLQIVEVYNDHHDKTYICNNGVRFQISRA